tara:strand:+ start:39 stop:767 length:729 start_codon:yes stop_codon:yes gene_type:complete
MNQYPEYIYPEGIKLEPLFNMEYENSCKKELNDKIFKQIFALVDSPLVANQVTKMILDKSESEINTILTDKQKCKAVIQECLEVFSKAYSKLGDTSATSCFECTDDKCSICLDNIKEKNKTITPCGHQFCFTCLYPAIEKQNKCPMCRAELIEKKDKKMKKLSDTTMADVITETMNDFNLRRHLRTAQHFSQTRNTNEEEDIIISSVQVYSLQLLHNIQQQQLIGGMYSDSEEEEESDIDDE